MRVESFFRTIFPEVYSAESSNNTKQSSLSSNILNVTNSLQEFGSSKSSQQGNSMGKKLPGLFKENIGKLASTTRSPDANGQFSQINSLYGGEIMDAYKTLSSYFTLPDKIALMDAGNREGKNTQTKPEISFGWREVSPSYTPCYSEKCQSGEDVSVPFTNDLGRADYIIELPSLERNLIKLDNNMKDDKEKTAHLHGIFGKGNTKIISEIAHQGHMAAPTSTGLAICKEGYILSQGNAAPQFIISKQEDGSCRITSSLTFHLKNIMTEKIVDGITLEMKRTSVLGTVPNNKTNLLSGAGEEKDGMSFKINYVNKEGANNIPDVRS